MQQIDIFWDKLLDYSKSKGLMLIGDFNVNLLKQNKFTRQLKNVIDNGYIDLDSELKQNTFIADTRIDYILVPRSFYELNQNISMTKAKYLKDNFDSQFQYSDHKMIVFEITT